jgi:signal transduction histidine kinase
LAVCLVAALLIASHAVAGIMGWHTTQEYPALLRLIWTPGMPMRWLTASLFLPTGAAVMLLARGDRHAAGISHGLMLPVASVAYSVPISHLLGVQRGIPLSLGAQMAFHTAVAFCFLAVAMFCVRPDTWLTSVFAGDTAGSLMARRLLPAIVVIPLLLAWLRQYGERSGRFGSEVGVVLAALAYTICLLALLGFTAASLNRSDLRRRRAEDALRRDRAGLADRVRERTAELEKTSQTLEAERQRFSDVLDVLPAYVILLTPDYHVAFANRFFEERFGEDRGRRCFEYLFQRSEPCETCETYNALRTREPHRWEWAGPDGRNYDIYDFPFTDADGSPLILEMGLDITDRKQLMDAQVALEKTKRLSDIGMLSATVAHELRNPLAAMKLAAFNISRKAKDSTLLSHIRTIEKKILESDQIINNLLFFSRMRTPHLELVDVSRVLDECVDTLARQAEKKIAIGRSLGPIRGAEIEVDQLQLREAVQNILNNAYDALPDDGGKIEIAAADEGGFVTVDFKDNGLGIEAEALKRVFDPFFTTKAKGTGLGLPVCRQMVEMHGGTITIASQPGAGTTVTIRLPKRCAQGERPTSV